MISGRNWASASVAEGQPGDDDEFSELESGGDYVVAELRQVVLVSVSDPLDEAVDTKAF